MTLQDIAIFKKQLQPRRKNVVAYFVPQHTTRRMDRTSSRLFGSGGSPGINPVTSRIGSVTNHKATETPKRIKSDVYNR